MNDKNNPAEAPLKAEKEKPQASSDNSKENEAKKAPSPFGPDVVPAMYIVLNTKLNEFGVIGEPGFLEDRCRAYGALKEAEKCLDDFYRQKKAVKAKFLMGVSAFASQLNMKKFLRLKKR